MWKSDVTQNYTAREFLNLILFLIYFLQFIFHSLPPTPSPLYLLHIPCLLTTPLCLHVDIPNPHPTWPLNSLGPPVSWGLGASSLNEHRPRSPLLYVCWGPHINWCMLSVWWSSVWEISGVQINWDYKHKFLESSLTTYSFRKTSVGSFPLGTWDLQSD